MVLVAATRTNVTAPYPSHYRTGSLGSCTRKTLARVRRALFTLADSTPAAPPGVRLPSKDQALVAAQGGQGIYRRRHYTAPYNRTLLSSRRGDDAVIFCRYRQSCRPESWRLNVSCASSRSSSWVDVTANTSIPDR